MTIHKNRPEHRNPREHIASAPYNFVPLPEKIIPDVPDAGKLPDHDRYYPEPDYHSGYFDVTLTTVSPLYIRGPITATDLPRQEEKEVKDNPAFFHTGDETSPVIPGSSLRGMLRALLEIVSYSKMKWVSEKQFFFRTVDGTALGQYYNRRMVKDLGALYPAHPRAHVYRALVEGGFFRVRENGTCFIEKCAVARVEALDLLRLFGLRDNHDLYEIDGRAVTTREDKLDPNQTPRWLYQHREIWAAIDEAEKDEFFREQRTRNGKIRHPDLYLRLQRTHNLALVSQKGKKQGKLVLTGHMNHKHMAFLFVPLKQPAPCIEIPNDPAEQDPNMRLLDRFHDDDQLTQWQKKAFPANRQPTGPESPGHLLDGDPVFFLRGESGNLVFFGRAQMFRLPYTLSPFDLVDPALHRATDIDYAEALFGFVRTRDELKELEKDGKKIPQGDKRRAYAGRVIVTDAVLQSDPADIWLGEAFHPRILATPKPTAFQHYLMQQHPDEKKRLNHYDSKLSDGEETTIRGHKLYWHQGLGLGTEQNLTLEQIRAAIKEEPGKVSEDDTQHTCLKPLKPGVQFSFRVYFENLSDRELGALCWTLHPHGEPDRRYCHHLGMGKPLGMGAVELHARLHLINRSQRYEKLFSDRGDSWQLGDANAEGEDLAVPDVLASRTRLFEEHLLQQLNPLLACKRLADMRRIAMLLKLLEWPGYRAEKDGDLYLEAEGRPNTRYMTIQPENEYRDRPVLPDPTQFDIPYFENKSRPQNTPARQPQTHQVEQPVRLDQQDGESETPSQAATEQQAPAEENGDLPVLLPEWARVIYIGNELRGMSNFTQGEQGVEVKFWDWDPTWIIGFIPKEELVGRPLGQRISVIITGLRQEPGGRIVVELKLRPKR
jgi:CRISPR-associated protein (TIGR03986 family)